MKDAKMISLKNIEEAMYSAMRRAATEMPPDVLNALQNALDEEQNPLARAHIDSCLTNARQAAEGKGLVCGDTGFPLFFVKVGNKTEIEGGITSIHKAACSATEQATAESFLRPNMVDPISRKNPGNNIGPGMPKVEIKFCDNIDGLDIIAAPKGGGSEIFGTFYRMMFPSDGTVGIKKFVIECIKDSCYAGKICPPAIIGIGLGGTADLCMKIAKEAALLRPLGQKNSDETLAKLEEELMDASRKLGIGPMGSEGINCAIGIHISAAATHTAALPVAFNAQCLVGRRWRAKINNLGEIALSGDIDDYQVK